MENQNVNVTEDVVEDATVENQEPNKANQKTFNQADVDRIVKDRLSKVGKNLEAITAEKDSIVATLQEYEGILTAIVAEKKKNVPEEFLEFFDLLPIQKQYEVLTKQESKLAPKKQIPNLPPVVTPKTEVVETSKPKKIKIF